MADIRLVRPQTRTLWTWVVILATLGLVLWASAFVLGDATDPDERPQVGAGLEIGEDRPPVIPAAPVPINSLVPFGTRDLGRYVRLQGTALSPARANAVWVRTTEGRYLLVRFQPTPPEGALRGIGPGTRVDMNGYIQKISSAEFGAWTDTLGVRIPRPPPGRKFGDLPDSGFIRMASMFVKTYYVSVRPEGIRPADGGGGGAGG